MKHSTIAAVPSQGFTLNPNLDRAELARAFAANRRIRIENLLTRDAVAALHDYLQCHDGWWHLINTPDGIFELDREDRARMTAKQRRALQAQIDAGVRTGFQYRYEGLRVPDGVEVSNVDNPLHAFSALMDSAPMLEFLRAVTGSEEISFSDGQATAYGPGDFLTGHDDNVAGKGRIAAYVFGLTPRWRIEWGGMLMFHDGNGYSATALMPRFNCLDLFAVPQLHSVSMVMPAAPERRFAVTGWLRTPAISPE